MVSKFYNIYALTGFLLHTYLTYYMVIGVNIQLEKPITPMTIWNTLSFLTNINQLMYFFYYSRLALRILQSKPEEQVRNSRFRQFLLTLGTFVTFSYWIIRFVNVRLVHGRINTSDIGEVYLILIHGGNLFLLFLEFFLPETAEPQIPLNQNTYSYLMIAYTILVAVQKFGFNRNVYGFVKPLNGIGIFAFIAAIYPLLLIDKYLTRKISDYYLAAEIKQIPLLKTNSISAKSKKIKQKK